jgi:Spy/CpxP family protein refolding chaperone
MGVALGYYERKNYREEVLNMKRLATSLVILVFIASLSFAQGMMQQKKGQTGGGMMGMQGGMMEHMMGGMHPMIYSMMVEHVLMRANTLSLTDTQRKELADIKEKYVYPMVHKEADFKISHMKIMDMLQDPNFDPAKVKAQIKASDNINLEMASMSVDALVAIRKAIGVENFKKAEMMPIMGGKMMRGGTPAPK